MIFFNDLECIKCLGYTAGFAVHTLDAFPLWRQSTAAPSFSFSSCSGHGTKNHWQERCQLKKFPEQPVGLSVHDLLTTLDMWMSSLDWSLRPLILWNVHFLRWKSQLASPSHSIPILWWRNLQMHGFSRSSLLPMRLLFLIAWYVWCQFWTLNPPRMVPLFTKRKHPS